MHRFPMHRCPIEIQCKPQNVTLNLLVVTIKKEKETGEINISNIFLFNLMSQKCPFQHVVNIKIPIKLLHTFLFHRKSSESVCAFHIQHISFWISYISHAQWSHVISGNRIRRCG